jgi:amino acid transporter
MDENNNQQNTNQMGGQLPKENPFKNKKFYVTYIITFVLAVAPHFILPLFLVSAGSDDYWMMAIVSLIIMIIPYLIIGIIVWAFTRKTARPLALGVLLGLITPFIAVLIFTGGCALFLFS